jgi:hypothetical protein
VYAVRSNRNELRQNLLPPEYHFICLWFYQQHKVPCRFHRDCPGFWPWHTEMERTYESPTQVITDLVTQKDLFWCHHRE